MGRAKKQTKKDVKSVKVHKKTMAALKPDAASFAALPTNGNVGPVFKKASDHPRAKKILLSEDTHVACPTCMARGYTYTPQGDGGKCRSCNGAGVVTNERKAALDVQGKASFEKWKKANNWSPNPVQDTAGDSSRVVDPRV